VDLPADGELVYVPARPVRARMAPAQVDGGEATVNAGIAAVLSLS
jgi:hypothetical protein